LRFAATKINVECSGRATALLNGKQDLGFFATGTGIDMKYRKHIRLRYYDYKTNGFYFVTMCSSKRLGYLNRYREIITNHLDKIPMKFSGVAIDYVKFMPDHVHIIFIFEESMKSLSQIIQWFKSGTTLLVKRNGFTSRYFWQANYYEHVIRSDKSLTRIREYIENNPLVEELNWNKLDP